MQYSIFNTSVEDNHQIKYCHALLAKNPQPKHQITSEVQNELFVN